MLRPGIGIIGKIMKIGTYLKYIVSMTGIGLIVYYFIK